MTERINSPLWAQDLLGIRGFEGELILQESARFDWARQIKNVRCMGMPAAVVRCGQVFDVQAVLGVARDHELPIAVRGGGHGAAGWSSPDGAVVIDLSGLRWVKVNPVERTAWVGGGSLAMDVILAAHDHGLAPVTGITGDVGVGGLLLGLGEGYLTSRHGFGVDNILELEVVTAAGDVIQVDHQSDPELFWGMRGAGANFGVVTAMKLRLHAAPVNTIGGSVTFSSDNRRGAIDYVWDLMNRASMDSWPSAAFYRGEDGAARVKVTLGHVGSLAHGEEELRRLRGVGTAISDTTRQMSYPELVQQGGAVDEHTLRPRAVWDIFRFPFDGNFAAQKQLVLDLQSRLAASPATYMAVWRTPRIELRGPSSAAPRYPGISVFVRSMWDDPAEDESQLVSMGRVSRAFSRSGLTRPAANTINHVSELDAGRLRNLYGEVDFSRLTALKTKHDPYNTFCHNANVPPTKS